MYCLPSKLLRNRRLCFQIGAYLLTAIILVIYYVYFYYFVDFCKIHQLPRKLVNQNISLTARGPRHNAEVSFLRAVLLDTPPDDREGEQEYSKRLRWFFHSWQHMLKTQPKSWRTDVVIIRNKPIPLCTELGCIGKPRRNIMEPNTCRCLTGYYTKYLPLKSNRRVSSFVAVLWKKANFDQYDWLLRCSVDTILTSGFSRWRPLTMVVGEAAYVFDGYLTAHRLERIAVDLGLETSGLQNTSLTWYGPVPLVQKCAKIAYEVMKFMQGHEFTKNEKSGELEKLTWPEWHYPMLVWYGSQLALSHMARQFNIRQSVELLDYPCNTAEPVAQHPLLHSWQDLVELTRPADFSKIKVLDNGRLNMSSLNLTVCSDYATYIALKEHA